ncbi:MAG: hypothetical protein AAFV54_13905, partial [Pseudomonadota bacterium]
MDGDEPIALDFDVGLIGNGVDLIISAEDLVAEFATDADTALVAGDITFITATVDGMSTTFDAIGFAYMPGSGVEGSFSIETEDASAFASLGTGDTAEVVVNFVVSDGSNTDTGTLTFSVSGTEVFADVTLSYLGAAVTDEELTADVTSGTGSDDDPIAEVVITGNATLEEILDAADLTTPLISSSGELTGAVLSPELLAFINTNDLTVAAALASDGAEATATAEDQSLATALAFGEGADANSTAIDMAFASSTATSDSTADADALNGGTATAAAAVSSVASA